MQFRKSFYKIIICFVIFSAELALGKELCTSLFNDDVINSRSRLSSYKDIRKQIVSEPNINNLLPLFRTLKTEAQKAPVLTEVINALYPRFVDADTHLKMTVLDIFDLKTIAQLQGIQNSKIRDRKLKDFFNQAQMYNEALPEDLSSIKSVTDLIELAQAVYKDLKFEARNYDVIMTFDSAGKIYSLPLNEKTYNAIINQPYLTVVQSKNRKKFDNDQVKQFEITYAQKDQYLKLFMLDPKAKNWSQKKIIAESINQLLLSFLNTNENVLQSPDKEKILFDRYKLFLTLHPWGDGNGRFSRLLYKVMQQHLVLEPAERGLTLPVYDLDLFLSYKEYKEQILLGALLKSWVSASETPNAFIQRSAEAVDLLKRLYPHLSTLMEPL